MLMMPPALATKSGVQRIPRACSSVGDVVRGELVVRGAGDRAAAQRRAPVARRARRPARTARPGRRRPRSASAGSAHAAPSSSASARFAGDDVGEHELGAGRREQRARARRRRARGRSPRSSGRRGRPCPRSPRTSRGSRPPRRAPSTGSGRPSRRAPPRGPRRGRPLRDHRHVAVGRADVLRRDVAAAERGDGVAEVEQRVAAARLVERRARRAGSMITPLPPPSGRPAAADLNVIARESRRASRTPRARVLVAPHAAAAQRRAAPRGVHGDGAVEAGARARGGRAAPRGRAFRDGSR